MYRSQVRGRDTIILVVAALLAMGVVVAVSPPLRLLVKLLYDSFRQFVFRRTQ